MKTINYIYYLILILFSFFILLSVYVGGHTMTSQVSKETIAKLTPIRVRIDVELLKNFVPANESNL